MSTFLSESEIWCSSSKEAFEPLEACALATPDFDPAALGVVVAGVIAAKQRLPEFERRLRLRVSGLPRLLPVAMPAADLRRALSHLVDNALEATSKSGRVLVTARARDGWAILRILDQGVGMSADVVRSLGKKRLLTGKPGGNGLGVFDAMKRVERYGGRIVVASVPRQGTVVTVTIPLAASGQTPALVALEIPGGIDIVPLAGHSRGAENTKSAQR